MKQHRLRSTNWDWQCHRSCVTSLTATARDIVKKAQMMPEASKNMIQQLQKQFHDADVRILKLQKQLKAEINGKKDALDKVNEAIKRIF